MGLHSSPNVKLIK